VPPAVKNDKSPRKQLSVWRRAMCAEVDGCSRAWICQHTEAAHLRQVIANDKDLLLDTQFVSQLLNFRAVVQAWLSAVSWPPHNQVN
jgi:hypothetical protein